MGTPSAAATVVSATSCSSSSSSCPPQLLVMCTPYKKPSLKELRELKESLSQYWLICMDRAVVEGMAAAEAAGAPSQLPSGGGQPPLQLHERFDSVGFFNRLNMGADDIASVTIPPSSLYAPIGTSEGDVGFYVRFKTGRGISLLQAKLPPGCGKVSFPLGFCVCACVCVCCVCECTRV